MSINGTPTPFSGILITGLIIVAVFISFAAITNGIANNYGKAITDTSYVNITAQSSALTNVAEQSSNIFFTNQTRTSSLSATERLLGSAYSVFLILGDLPAVFNTVINVIVGVTADVLGLPAGIAGLVDAGIIMIILGTIIYLAVGRR